MVKKRAKNGKLPARRAGSEPAPTKLLNDLRDLIQSTRSGLAQAVNSALVLLYWQVGQRIRSDVLKSRRATYGDEICSTLSNELAVEFGNGYSRPNLTRMIRFAEVFPDREVVVTLSRCLGWSHFVEIIYLEEQGEKRHCGLWPPAGTPGATGVERLRPRENGQRSGGGEWGETD
jgi:DUF1016 N-terminal domain